MKYGQHPAPALSIILLMYNEEACIQSTLQETLSFCTQTLHDWEILVIDDGSTDKGPSLVAESARMDPRIRLVSHPVNRGMGAAMATGIRHASKSHFIFNAADGQVAATEIGHMIPLLSRADIVVTTYSNRRESLSRHILSRSFRLYLRALTGIRFKLEGLYLFPTDLGQAILPHLHSHDTFFFSFDLIATAQDQGATLDTTAIRCKPRLAGQSKVAKPKKIAKVGVEVLRHAWNKRFRTE